MLQKKEENKTRIGHNLWQKVELTYIQPNIVNKTPSSMHQASSISALVYELKQIEKSSEIYV